MKFLRVVMLGLAVLLAGCASPQRQEAVTVSRILFGSCINTNSHPMLDRVGLLDFDLAIMLGDNIYADTTNMTRMAAKYQALKVSPFWKRLHQQAPVLATWDDHDFGWNDAGEDYPMRDESQRLFLEFLDEPATSRRWKQRGVYDSYVFGPKGRRVQVIMLDTRYFRSKPMTGNNGVVPSGGRYIPHTDPSSTVLGAEQWNWLEARLREPADVRIIGSSIQFISEFSGGEAWANFPHEKRRMLELLKTTRANGVIFISGDRHWAELSRLDRPGDYPLYELTASALTQKHPRGTPTPNKYRVPGTPTYHDANAGFIEIDWNVAPPRATFTLVDVDGQTRLEGPALAPANE